MAGARLHLRPCGAEVTAARFARGDVNRPDAIAALRDKMRDEWRHEARKTHGGYQPYVWCILCRSRIARAQGRSRGGWPLGRGRRTSRPALGLARNLGRRRPTLLGALSCRGRDGAWSARDSIGRCGSRRGQRGADAKRSWRPGACGTLPVNWKTRDASPWSPPCLSIGPAGSPIFLNTAWPGRSMCRWRSLGRARRASPWPGAM